MLLVLQRILLAIALLGVLAAAYQELYCLFSRIRQPNSRHDE